jgi:hypothetical protein
MLIWAILQQSMNHKVFYRKEKKNLLPFSTRNTTLGSTAIKFSSCGFIENINTKKCGPAQPTSE